MRHPKSHTERIAAAVETQARVAEEHQDEIVNTLHELAKLNKRQNQLLEQLVNQLSPIKKV